MVFVQVNEDPTTRIINELRGEVLRLREQLLLSQGNGVSGNIDVSSRINAEAKSSLLQAEEALRNYAKQWEAKQQSMRIVKSKLLKKRHAAYGAGDLAESEIHLTPHLISLSNDPMLHMAVTIYLPAGGALRVGRPQTGDNFDEGQMVAPDLQLEGLGIEAQHCTITNDRQTSVVTLTCESSAVTYINGRPVGGLSQQLFDGDRIVLGHCSHLFCFCDPRSVPEDSFKDTSSVPTYQQALREILLGRVETDSERRERLGALVSVITSCWNAYYDININLLYVTMMIIFLQTLTPGITTY